MSTEDASEKRAPEIVSDEDWKSRVKAEDAALDAGRSSAPSAASAQADETAEEQTRRPQIDPSQIPPVDFTLLVTMFSTQTMVALGMFPNPLTGEVEIEPALAKHYIDLLSVLEAKTKGNLDSREEQLLSMNLHQLRMAYVQISSRTA